MKNILVFLFVIVCCSYGSVIKDKDYEVFDTTTDAESDGIWVTEWTTPKYPPRTKTFIVNARHEDQVDCGRYRKRNKCVSWYLCKNSSIVTDGSFLIDDRASFGQPSRKTCPSTETCCTLANEITPEVETFTSPAPPRVTPGVTPRVVPVRTTTSAPPRTTRGYDRRPKTTTSAPTPRPPRTRPPLGDDCKIYKGEFKKPQRCGARNVNGFKGMIKSESNKNAQYGEFPWMMAILRQIEDEDGNKDWRYRCGGSLIHSKLVITAAHPLNQIATSKIMVRAGEWDAQSQGEYCPVQEKFVAQKHDNNYNPRTKENNIMLLVLEEAFQLTAVVNTICLPASSFNFENSLQPGCYATGWGAEKYGDSKFFQNFLKRVQLPVVPRTTCDGQLNVKEMVGGRINLTPTQICAGGIAGEDMCTGDGGSPLACRNPEDRDPVAETYYLAGIVTAGIEDECGRSNTPGVYEDVTKHLSWIKKMQFDLKLSKEYW